MLVIALIAMVVELIPMVKKKQGKESSVLLLIGTITIAYGYYYNTHEYIASFAALVFNIFNIR